MLVDIRIQSELPRHRKFKRLKRIVGPGAMEHLVTFWCTVAEQLPNGALNGWSNDDIEDAANWDGEAGVFISAMVESGFLDVNETGFEPHDWAENQPWASKARDRIESARKAGKASVCVRRERYGTAQPPNDSRTDRSKTVPNDSRTPSPTPNSILKENYPFRFKKAVPIPSNFHLTDDMRAYANKRLFKGDLEKWTHDMILSARSGGYKKVDWHATWKKWLSNHIDRHPECVETEKVYL